MNKFIKFAAVLSVVMLLAAPIMVSAAGGAVMPTTNPDTTPTAFSACGDLACLVSKIVTIALAIVFFVAVIFLVIGGFRYIISQGNEEGVEKAKGTITNAIIGIVVTLLAWIILRAVFALLNQGPTGTGT